MSRFIVVFLLFFSLWASASDSVAANIEVPSVVENKADLSFLERFQQASDVRRVMIDRIGALVDPTMSEGGMLAIGSYRYTATSLKQWKGSGAPLLVFQMQLSDCSTLLAKGGEYVIFSQSSSEGQVVIRCEDVIAAEQAREAEDLLNKLAENN